MFKSDFGVPYDGEKNLSVVMPEKLWIASDHAGFSLKTFLLETFDPTPYVWHDLGPHTLKAVDYPDYAHLLAHSIRPQDRGVLICGSGIGMSITINKYPHIRAALCRTPLDASLSRLHNNANVVCLGGRITHDLTARKILNTFLTLCFEGGRHERRVEKINNVG